MRWPSWREAARRPRGGHAESTLAQAAWERTHKAVARWAWVGLVGGVLVALVAFAPATWLAAEVAARSGQRLLLADARGTLWKGSAVPVLTGGPGSRSAAMLPGRLGWQLSLRGLALELRLRQACCIRDELRLLLRPGMGRLAVQLLPGSQPLGEWPAAWLVGLGAPWNSLRLDGTLRLSSQALQAEATGGRWSLTGQAELELDHLSSALTTLDRLGSYRVHLDGTGTRSPTFTLDTVEGALQLSGSGQWTGSQFRFRGEARAAPGAERELDNLLNFLGRRRGALSLISIG